VLEGCLQEREGRLLVLAGSGRLRQQTRPAHRERQGRDEWGTPSIHRVSPSLGEALEGVEGLRLDHLGVAVRSIASALGFYEGLGLLVSGEETVEGEAVRVAMLPLGETRVELLEPVGEGAVVGRFLARRGEGLHHIALRCTDLDGMFARLKARGVRLASERIGVGAGGHRYFFVHPSSTGGVLVELVAD